MLVASLVGLVEEIQSTAQWHLVKNQHHTCNNVHMAQIVHDIDTTCAIDDLDELNTNVAWGIELNSQNDRCKYQYLGLF